MFKAALFGRGAPLFGATWPDGKPAERRSIPFQQPVKLDLDKAREYLKAAGLPEGFSTTFSFNVGQASTAEPMAALVKESLGKIGIKVDIQKLPDAQMSTQINEKKLPFFTEGIVAWLPSTDYFYRNFYTGNQRWNYSSINNPELVRDRAGSAVRAGQGQVRGGRPQAQRHPSTARCRRSCCGNRTRMR